MSIGGAILGCPKAVSSVVSGMQAFDSCVVSNACRFMYVSACELTSGSMCVCAWRRVRMQDCSYVYFSFSLLFTVKGEMRDTAQLGALQTYLVDRFSNAFTRRDLFRSWLSIGMLL